MTILFVTIFTLLVSCGTIYSQAESIINEVDSTLYYNNSCDSLYNKICPPGIFSHPQELAAFPGGEGEMIKFITENLTYPSEYKRDSIQGRVIVRFIINEFGEITCLYINKSLHWAMDKEAIRIVELMPDWKPASNNGTPCKTCYTLPILFKL